MNRKRFLNRLLCVPGVSWLLGAMATTPLEAKNRKGSMKATVGTDPASNGVTQVTIVFEMPTEEMVELVHTSKTAEEICDRKQLIETVTRHVPFIVDEMLLDAQRWLDEQRSRKCSTLA